ncbi:MAG: metallophosphoesterase [Spirochaetales bacterium]|nr:metallophosphoesterase [Spirochaetales bacterium]
MRIAHVSDLHLPVIDKSESESLPSGKMEYELLEQTISRISGLNVDILIIPGDILEIAEQDSINLLMNSSTLALQNIVESYHKIRDILDASKLKYMILPGNHDHEMAFWQVFDRKIDLEEIGGYTIVCFADSLSDKRIPERRGRELLKFQKMLSDPAKQRQIHFQHYLLTDPPEEDYAYSYKDYKRLQQEIVTSGLVLMCLSGHYHKGMKMLNKSGTFFSVGPAFCAPHRKYRVYQIQDSNVEYRDYQVGS